MQQELHDNEYRRQQIIDMVYEAIMMGRETLDTPSIQQQWPEETAESETKQ